MKKKISLLFLFIGGLIIYISMLVYNSKQFRVYVDKKGELKIKIITEFNELDISPWMSETEGKCYIFLPSFCDNNIYWYKHKDMDIYLDDKLIKNRAKISLEESKEYRVEILDKEGNEKKYNLIFVKAQSLPTVFINTKSGNMKNLLENKENEENAYIYVIREKGNVEYSGNIQKISGRGNTTWKNYDKKSFAMTLYDEKALCGLEAGKDWNLLAIHGEGNKMATKLTMEMSKYVGMESTMENTWVDVYFNGEYNGIYLLSEAVKVAESRVDIYNLESENQSNNADIDMCSVFETDNYKGYNLPNVTTITGGYLIEKDAEEYWINENCGFKTNEGNFFTVKAPKHASEEQMEYIYKCVNEVEKRIKNNSEDVFEYIDINSFAKRYMLDEIIQGADVNVTSTYFYKKKNDNKLYAGPIWDCDSVLGTCNLGYMEGKCVNYTSSVNIPFRNESLMWNKYLCENVEFENVVRDEFMKILPFMEKILIEDINEYKELIGPSIVMDEIRWGRIDIEGKMFDNYQTYENNVRYLKYYLVKRLNYLIDYWNVEYEKFEFEENEELHTVQYVLDGDVIETRKFKDGEEIRELPYLDEEKYWGWYYTYNDCKTREWLPVLEDCIFYAREK